MILMLIIFEQTLSMSADFEAGFLGNGGKVGFSVSGSVGGGKGTGRGKNILKCQCFGNCVKSNHYSSVVLHKFYYST